MGRVGASDAGVKLLRILAVHPISTFEPRYADAGHASVYACHCVLLFRSQVQK